MEYYVYIATNKRDTVLYTGVTNNLERRIYEHRTGVVSSFSKKYNICKVVYFTSFSNPEEAIAAEKKIKGWKREKKIKLIRSMNPDFGDLLG